MRMFKFLSSVCVVALLTGCVTQRPVDVVSGGSTSGLYPSSYVVTTPTEQGFAERKHYTVAGDTLYSVSKNYGVPIDALYKKNGMDNRTMLQEGQRVVIPSSDWLAANNYQVQTQATASNYRLTEKYESAKASTKRVFERVIDSLAGETNAKSVKQQVTAGKVAQKSVQISTIEPAAGKVQATSGVKHVVKPGENIYRIGLRYNVTQKALMSANGISSPQSLYVGQELTIPGVNATVAQRESMMASVEPAGNKNTKDVVRNARAAVANSAEGQAASVSINAKDKYAALMKKYRNEGAGSRGMIWPAKGKVVSKFGDQGKGVNHTGIAIALPVDAPVRAAESGTVIYSDDGLKSYGNLILVKHSSGYVTAYAHNAANMVKKNQKVRKGDVIAFAGNTGNVDRTQLHFEVRKNSRPINPLGVLPN